MATRVTIRPVIAADEAEWRRLFKAYHVFYEASVTDAVYTATFARILGDDPWQPFGLIAEVNGRAAGLVHYLFHSHTWREERITYLQDLYADPDVRGHGVGRALIEAVYRAADEAGAPGVYWTTQHFNETARLLYDRIGELTPFIKYQRPR
ncbi:GNAT family N-acetyltransferase [Acuticoccus sp. I52.16.1]|uniref:GNAT family N-acetyltransferase n=1 Tax=Acuticoccus sp. I52.16.1 TaxID=2928472 RepID=UPI001FD05CFE|nr:GNAT family N-acetyltransferase [Acuticoccus sp. I52.16.1]UOM34447.1 GNAT family N-acetyltransferase [Acuticoccus sp. I52.16.1]